mgnify:CR=1 FL=1
MTSRSHGEQALNASDCGADPSFVGYSASLVVPFKVLLFLGVILNLRAHYTIFTEVTQEATGIYICLRRRLWYCFSNMIETETQAPSEAPKSSANVDPFEDNLAMQDIERSEAALAAERMGLPTPRPVEATTPTSPEPGRTSNPNSVLNKVIVTAAILSAGTGGATIGAASEATHNDTEKVIASTPIGAPGDHGNFDIPAKEAVEDLLEANGLDKNTISYETVRNEFQDASNELKELTGQKTVDIADRFDVDLITSTGMFGDERTTIDITSQKVEEAAQNTTTPTQDDEAIAIPTPDTH